MQRADGTANLDIFYSHQFVQNEVGATDAGADATSVYSPFEHTPILTGTVTGTVYDGAVAIQTFSVSSAGVFNFTDIGTPSPKATSAGSSLNATTGVVTIAWTGGNPMITISLQVTKLILNAHKIFQKSTSLLNLKILLPKPVS